MDDHTGVNRAGNFAQTAEDEGEGEDVYADVPLAMENTEDDRYDKHGRDDAKFASEFAIEEAAEDDFFSRCT